MGLAVVLLAAAGLWAWNTFGAAEAVDLPPEAVTLYSRAKRLADAGRIGEARTTLSSLLTMHPDFVEARELLDELSSTGSSEVDVPLLIARLREAVFSGSLGEAEAFVDEALAAPDLAREEKVQVLRHAARDFTQADDVDRARRTVDRMLDLEPPLVMLHPSVEPPELIAIYAAARRARPAPAPLAMDVDSVRVSVAAIAVSGLEGEDRTNLATGVEAVVVGELAPALTVVERSSIGVLAQEIALAEPGDAAMAGYEDGPDFSAAVNEADRFYIAYEAAMAGTLGPIVAETHIVYGSVGVSGDRLLVGLWAVSVEQATVVGFGQAEGAMPEGIFDAVERASRSLVESLEGPRPGE